MRIGRKKSAGILAKNDFSNGAALSRAASGGLSLLLITAVMFQLVFFGQSPKAAASAAKTLSSAVSPAVSIPAVTMPPERFGFSSSSPTAFTERRLPSLSPLSFLGVWEDLIGWLGFASSEKNESKTKTANSETALVAPLPPVPSTADLSRARLSPKNAVGGTNLYSRNFGWSAGLVGLSGRAGFDTGLSISYNSLIWVKSGGDIVFKPDHTNISPGFRLGFPMIEPSYSDPLTGKNTHLVTMPSGERVEFRQVGSTNAYEPADSSYAQLRVINSNLIVISMPDAKEAVYERRGNVFLCSQIVDRNGNHINLYHDSYGLLQWLKDTLGRVVYINYDGSGRPLSITQGRASGTHTFATFTYANQTISTNFSGLNLIGITNNSSITVLQKITFADSSYVQFDYNSYGQVWKISNYAADNHKLSHTAVNLESFSQAQTDAPRFSEIRSWAENFNLNGGGQAQETVIPVNYQENQSYSLPDGTQGAGTLVELITPNGAHSKTFFGASGWLEGLPIVTEDLADGGRPRWSRTVYTQDDPNLGYRLNPRAVESKIGDQTNVRRTTIEYHTQAGNPAAALFGLVKDVVQYDTNGTSQLKRSHFEYNLGSTYLSYRVIGLPSETTLYDAGNNLMSKVTYQYDEGNFSGANQNIAPIQHNTASYGSGFIVGRGNLTSVTRWDATAPNNSSLAVTSSTKYDTAGSPVAQTDSLNRTVSINYADSFDDLVNRNTHAYPTALTDPAGYSSTVKYRFDTGANVYATSPAPAGQSAGKTTSRIYDSIGRLEKETILNTGAYTRYEYPTNGIQSKVFSTVVDTNQNGADAADEVLSESWTDGAGRTRMARSEHPNSAGGWSASITEYDVMGRVKRSSVPTEVNSSWQPAGDDATRGFLWTTNEYDWKGRVTRVINTDGTDKLMSYDGCGCAGGQVATIQSELVPRDDQPTVNARRTQKAYQDILGRTYKTETLDWNGAIYATTKTFFNGRDQATLVREYAGSEASSTYHQDTTMTYDGHGRLMAQHRPEQNANTATTYVYNPDDTVQLVTDARGASRNYTYNSRKLVTQISYAVPGGSQIPVTPTVTFGYDNLGNRTQMTDGMGSVSYEYNQLSQLTAETRSFSDYLPNAPLANNSFRLQYSYQLGGQMQSYTDAYGQQFNYGQDKTGRLQTVTGSTAFGGVTNYANNAQYRAFGALKSLSYGDNPAQMNLTFNNRLQAATHTVSQSGSNLIHKEYSYLASGEIGFINDQLNATTFLSSTEWFDRSFIYDHLGRVTRAYTGEQARGGTDTHDHLPYSLELYYDQMGHALTSFGKVWTNDYVAYEYAFLNNRNVGDTYDADGNLLQGEMSYTYDAAGAATFSVGMTVENTMWFDGDGQELKRLLRTRQSDQYVWRTPSKLTYFIKSSVMDGKLVNEVKSNGAKERTYVYGAGAVVALQGYDGANAEHVNWQHYDASGKTLRYTSQTSVINLPAELEASGNDVGVYAPLQQPTVDKSSPNENQAALALMDVGGCELDGVAIDCSQLSRMGNALAVNITDDRGEIIDTKPVEIILGRLWIPQYSARYSNGQLVRDGNQVLKRRDGFSVIDLKTLNQEKCDFRLARIFGGDDAVFATEYEPNTLLSEGFSNGSPAIVKHPAAGTSRTYAGGKYNPREAPSNGVAHMYANPEGKKDENAYSYVPPGYTGRPKPVELEDYSEYKFKYLPGALNGYGYNGGLEIVVVHTGTIPNGSKKLLPVGQAQPNAMGSIAVGIIGNSGRIYETGGGSRNEFFVHNHYLFFKLDKNGNRIRKGKEGYERIDPRSIFCSDLGF